MKNEKELDNFEIKAFSFKWRRFFNSNKITEVKYQGQLLHKNMGMCCVFFVNTQGGLYRLHYSVRDEDEVRCKRLEFEGSLFESEGSSNVKR